MKVQSTLRYCPREASLRCPGFVAVVRSANRRQPTEQRRAGLFVIESVHHPHGSSDRVRLEATSNSPRYPATG
jgi:hypothetical protein